MKYEMPEKWVEAVNAGKVDEIMDCYEEQASLLATFEARPLKSFEGIRDYFVGFTSKKGAGVRIEEASLSHQSLGGDFYLAMGLYEFYYQDQGNLVRHPARFTFTIKTDSGEKIIHHHSSLIPPS